MMTIFMASIKTEFVKARGMERDYRASDFRDYRKEQRKRNQSRSSRIGAGRELTNGLTSAFWMTLNLVLSILGVLIAALIVSGWLRFVAFGKVDNDAYWKRLVYDFTHIDQRNSQNRLKNFAQGVLHGSESSASLF